MHSRRTVPTHGSATAFAFGARTGVLTTRSPSVRNTSSKAPENFESRSRSRMCGTVALATGVGIRETRAMRSRRHLPVRPALRSAFSVYRLVQRFAPEFAEAARARQHIIGDRWHVDETYLKVDGSWRYLFRAIDQF